MAPPFKGKIELDVRDSTPDWAPFTPPRPPEGSPNVLIILYDDTGLSRLVPIRWADQHADAPEAGGRTV